MEVAKYVICRLNRAKGTARPLRKNSHTSLTLYWESDVLIAHPMGSSHICTTSRTESRRMMMGVPVTPVGGHRLSAGHTDERLWCMFLGLMEAIGRGCAPAGASAA